VQRRLPGSRHLVHRPAASRRIWAVNAAEQG
jgi:hypothetical protein